MRSDGLFMLKSGMEKSKNKFHKGNIVKNNGTKLFSVVFIFALLCVSAITVQPALASNPVNLDVSASTQTLTAGTTNSVSFTITNSGGAEATNITVSISVSGLPMILSGSDGNYFISSLNAGQSNTITVPIYVSPTAAGGFYQITFAISYDQHPTAPVTRTIGFSVPTAPSPVQIATNVSPQTLQIGTVNVVNFTVSNQGTINITSVQAILTLPQGVSGAPFTLENSDGKYFVGNLTTGQGVNITADLFVSPSAAGAIYPFTLSLTYYDNFGIARQETRTLYLNVPQAIGPVINMTLSTNGLVSGTVNNITLTVQNAGDRAADAVTVQVTLPGSVTGTTTAILEGSNGIWTFDSLNPGDIQSIPLQLFVNPSISGTLISITVTSSFSDSGYKPSQQTNSFGMIVRGNIDLVTLGTSTFPSTVVAGQPFSLTVNFINLGTATAESFVLTPNGTSLLQPTSSTNIFLGDLSVNVPSSFSISFNTAKGMTTGQYNVNLPYTYKDPLGNSYSGVINIPFSLTITTNSTSGGSTGGSGGGFPFVYMLLLVIVIIVIVVLLLYWIMRRRSRAAK